MRQCSVHEYVGIDENNNFMNIIYATVSTYRWRSIIFFYLKQSLARITLYYYTIVDVRYLTIIIALQSALDGGATACVIRFPANVLWNNYSNFNHILSRTLFCGVQAGNMPRTRAHNYIFIFVYSTWRYATMGEGEEAVIRERFTYTPSPTKYVMWTSFFLTQLRRSRDEGCRAAAAVLAKALFSSRIVTRPHGIGFRGDFSHRWSTRRSFSTYTYIQVALAFVYRLPARLPLPSVGQEISVA